MKETSSSAGSFCDSLEDLTRLVAELKSGKATTDQVEAARDRTEKAAGLLQEVMLRLSGVYLPADVQGGSEDPEDEDELSIDEQELHDGEVDAVSIVVIWSLLPPEKRNSVRDVARRLVIDPLMRRLADNNIREEQSLCSLSGEWGVYEASEVLVKTAHPIASWEWVSDE